MLEDLFNRITQEQKDLVRRKATLNQEWVLQRLRCLSQYRQTVREAAGIGRALGDAFAWFFYQFSQGLLAEHLRHPAVKVFPTGDGGMAEVALARRVLLFEGHLLIHHSITSILRLGDLSFFDLKERKIEAVGEMKSTQVANGEYQTRLSVLSLGRSPVPKVGRSNLRQRRTEQSRLPVALQTKLRQQLRRIDRALAQTEQPPVASVGIDARTNRKALEDLATAANRTGSAVGKLDASLVALMVKVPGRSLFRRLTATSGGEFDENVLLDLTRSTCVGRPELNSLHIANMLYADDGMPRFLLGSVPLLWSTLSEEVARQLYFQELVPTIAFNPAPILHRLEGMGFEVQRIGGHELDVAVQRKGTAVRLQGLRYYFLMLMTGSLAADGVIEAIDKSLAEAERRKCQQQGGTLTLYLRPL
jgi:hypothetical protein